VRGRRNDQGGRWPLGIWFALVGMSAGTVASFSLIGWTFTRGLDNGGGAQPLEYESETVILEAEPTTGPEGAAGGAVPEGLFEPGAVPEFAASPAEPRAERMPEADDGNAPAHAPREHEPESAEPEPPQLVPVDEGDGGGEEALEPGGEPDDPDWDGDRDHDDRVDLHLDLVLEEIGLDLIE
jgi:hypothetical protein